MPNNGLTSGIPLEVFRAFLLTRGFQFRFVPGGYEKWHRPGENRPVILRMYHDTVSLFVVRTALRNMKLEQRELEEFMEKRSSGIE